MQSNNRLGRAARIVAGLLLAALTGQLRAYVSSSTLWPGPTINFRLNMSTVPLPAMGLRDGATSWNQVIQATLSDWNAQLGNVQFVPVIDAVAATGVPNGINNVIWNSTVYGQAWGTGVLAVAITYTQTLPLPAKRVESDVLFNSNVSFDSYRGVLSGAVDVKRVALHEFGHVLCLGHSDDSPATIVPGSPTPIMNSFIGNTDTLTIDDIAGAVLRYGVPSPGGGGGGATGPSIISVTHTATVTVGGTATFTVAASGTAPLGYQWYKGVAPVAGGTSATLTISNVQASHSGSYTVLVTNSVGSVSSNPVTLTVEVPGTPPSIVTHPTSQAVATGSNVSFSVSVSGAAPLSYQWRKGVVVIGGATGPTLLLSNVQPGDAGSYTVTITNSLSSVTSNPAILTVFAATSAPTIAKQPESKTVDVGANVDFTVVATGSPPLTYQWRKGDSTIVGATNATLTLSAVQVSSAGKYSVTVLNPVSFVSSTDAILTVIVPLAKPSIITQPANQIALLGENVTFTVEVTGALPLTYQWRKNDVPISGATGASLALPTVQAGDAGTYTVKISNSIGDTVSEPALLAVISPPVFTTQPASQAAVLGTTVTMTVVVGGTQPINLQWRKAGSAIAGAVNSTFTIDNVQLSNAGVYTVTAANVATSVTSQPAVLDVVTVPAFVTHPANLSVTSGGTAIFSVVVGGIGPFSYQWLKEGQPISGATLSNLTLSQVQPSDAANYSVRVTNAAGASVSSPAQLVVNVLPVITSHPLSRSFTAGSTVIFDVTATGTQPLRYQWYLGGAPIVGATASTFVIGSAQTTDAGAYTVVVSNAAGSVTSNVATLAFGSLPVIVTPPLSQTVTAGSSVTFTVVVSGTAPFTYQWRRAGFNMIGETGATLTLHNVQPADSVNYYVVVTNAAGPVSSAEATLTVNVVNSPPLIVTQPANQSAAVGSTVTFTVTATGATPLSYQWLKGGNAIPGASSSTFVMFNVQSSDAGSYAVRVSNSAGLVTSSAATLTVTIPSAAPAILTPPANQSVTAGASVTFSVTASGTAPLSYQWLKGGVAIPGATSSSITLLNVQQTDGGGYAVTVSNSAGSVTSSTATLTVTAASAAPVIVTPPASQSVTLGASVTFSVTATGTAPLSYQWLRDGVAIPGATLTSITLLNVQLTDSSGYAVTVSNSAGTVTSAPAQLTVSPAPVAPTITQHPSSQTVIVGTGVTFTVQATGTGPLQYQWRKGQTAVPGATSATFTLPNPQVSDAGGYNVVVTNAQGSVVSNDAVLTVNLELVSRLSNVSVLTTLSANQTLTMGFSMVGGSKQILARAVGPGLTFFGVPNVMPDPKMALYKDGVQIQANDNWGGSAALSQAFASVGGFALPANSLDAALLRAIEGGNTVEISGSVAGNVLVEIYDSGPGDSPRLVNLSARNRVGPGGEVLVAGITVSGTAPKAVLIRAIGPTLSGFGVPGVLPDPKLEVFSGQTKIAENDSWAATLTPTFESVAAFPLTPGSKDAALVITLAPGGYTVQISSADGGTGEALIEAYELP